MFYNEQGNSWVSNTEFSFETVPPVIRCVYVQLLELSRLEPHDESDELFFALLKASNRIVKDDGVKQSHGSSSQFVCY